MTICESNNITGGSFSDGTLTLSKAAGDIQISGFPSNSMSNMNEKLITAIGLENLLSELSIGTQLWLSSYSNFTYVDGGYNAPNIVSVYAVKLESDTYFATGMMQNAGNPILGRVSSIIHDSKWKMYYAEVDTTNSDDYYYEYIEDLVRSIYAYYI